VTNSTIVSNLLSWYAVNARELPWRRQGNHKRRQSNPYAVWISEIMLQQTRVETVIPYYERWMAHFPTLAALAAASQQEVLSQWEGLGYYSRARNLHLAAQRILADYDGCFPSDVNTLRKLPGIGRYSAGAIASIAFDADEAALDGNIRRILARVFNLTEPAKSPAGERQLWQWATSLLPPGRAGDFNQALMDLGSSICLPQNPNCSVCPLAEECQARRLGVQAQRPVVIPKPPIPHYMVTAAVIRRNDRWLITQRPANGLLGGLWEFPGGKQQPGEELAVCLQREIQEELGVAVQVGEPVGIFRHAYTHYRVTLHAFYCDLPGAAQPQIIQVQDLRWVTAAELVDYPMGKIDRQIATLLVKQYAQPALESGADKK
jgi:A/G-specific adenine glycosylase